ncbi:MAG: SDR family NAD(P)-dependent oxidoreductase [Flavobacteriales bacterium]|nr:SDR family NAD(P)-dependent oxidoreductase [Flavobacteriales bacterium]
MNRQVVLVTGGSSGIGLSTCQHLKAKGFKVYGTSRKISNGAKPYGFPMVQMEITDRKSIQNGISYVLRNEGRIDILVNNAGTGVAGAVEDASIEEIDTIFRLIVFAAIEVTNSVIPSMRENGGGRIINISSVGAEFGLPFRGIYSASKAALDRFSETLRLELSPWGISVSTIQPGDIKTNINNSRITLDKSNQVESPYYGIFQKTYRQINKEVASAKDPIIVAKIVERIIKSKSPKMRYPAASFIQRFSLTLNRILPTEVFQKILKLRYPVK